MHDGSHAFRHCDAGQVDRVAGFQVRQIDRDKFWQVAWQAGDIQFSHDVADDGAGQFDRWGNLSIDEVQRHLDVDFVACINALEIDVQNELFVSVDLEVAQQDFFYFAVDFEIEDRSVKRFFLQCVIQRIVIQCEVDCRLSATVDDARCLTRNTQAAARSGAL